MEGPAIQPVLAERLTSVHGERGREWIAAFPRLLRDVCDRWEVVELGKPFAYVGFAWVAPGRLADGTAVVLKLAPSDPEYSSEIEAMKRYAGLSAARYIDGDPTAVAILLERLEPGTTLAEVDDDVAATEIAGGIMTRLFRPLEPGHPFPTIERWGQAFRRVREAHGGGCGVFPSELFDPAERIYFELCAGAAAPVLLHGDLHHWNILRAEREPWLAIDPKGLAGEPAYEVGSLLRNRMGVEPDLLGLTLRRIDQLAGILSVDRQRLVLWAFAQGVLSVLWSFEDDGQFSEDRLALPRALLPMVN